MIGSFLLGLILLAGGFVMVWKSRSLYQNVGDLAQMLDIPKGGFLLQWPVLGSMIMFLGLLLMVGILSSSVFFIGGGGAPTVGF